MPKKTNPNEITSRKRKKRTFEPSNFVHYKNYASEHKHNNFAIVNNRSDEVVEIKRLTPSDKTFTVGVKM